ncbi:hypothetical protein [Photobacterium profundum]|uniref:Uncharacterized protein n=1 Tax=Photobacterium profundum (strain SS9) TaxID=298386 RepID=Q6LQS4_PHOPR|nr:hypothetical protein [Photobacterium profundum]CAG20352.1 Hypothetical protein PBPRA1948 [Photobacterium profundum SS9]
MFGKLKNKAKELSSSNDTDNEMGSRKINEIIQSQWPKIEGILLERMIPLAGDKINDDEFITKAFENTYEFLPMPIRMLLSKEKFVSYCKTHKEPLIEKINELNNVK